MFDSNKSADPPAIAKPSENVSDLEPRSDFEERLLALQEESVAVVKRKKETFRKKVSINGLNLVVMESC